MGRRNRPRREGKTTKKRRIRERRAEHRDAWERLRSEIVRQARVSADGIAVGLTAEMIAQRAESGVEPNLDFPVIPARWHSVQRAVFCTDEGVIEPSVAASNPRPAAAVEINDRRGFTRRFFVRRWKKLRLKEIQRLLALEWEPHKTKDAVSALGDVAMGYYE